MHRCRVIIINKRLVRLIALVNKLMNAAMIGLFSSHLWACQRPHLRGMLYPHIPRSFRLSLLHAILNQTFILYLHRTVRLALFEGIISCRSLTPLPIIFRDLHLISVWASSIRSGLLHIRGTLVYLIMQATADTGIAISQTDRSSEPFWSHIV